MDSELLWTPGDQIVIRGVTETGVVVTGKAVTVVEDSPARTAMYFPHGSPFERKLRQIKGGRYADDSRTNWTQFTVERNNILMLFYPHRLYSIWLMWDHGTGEFVHWYADLQTTPVRTAIGFDRYDLDLDVVVNPDLTWLWKDEKEFQTLLDLRVFNAATARAVRQAGEDVIARAQNRQPPFNEGWECWHPNPAWPIPRLIPGWKDFPATPTRLPE